MENECNKLLVIGRGFVPTRFLVQASIRALHMVVFMLWLDRHPDVVLVFCDDSATARTAGTKGSDNQEPL